MAAAHKHEDLAAQRGRAFVPADDEPGRSPVLVLSHRAWLQHYAADPSVVGSAA